MDDDSGIKYLHSIFGDVFDTENNFDPKSEYKVVANLSLFEQNCLISIQRNNSAKNEPPTHIHYRENKLTFDLPEWDKNISCQLEVPETAFSVYLHKKFHPEKFTKSEVRTTLQFLADSDLAYSAEQDHVSLETKKSHYKSAASKMGISKQARLVSTLLSGILIELSLSYDKIPMSEDNDKSTFLKYYKDYLPESVRELTLLDKKGFRHRVLDMGSLAGEPIILLSSMVLPDIRPCDIEMMISNNVRMLCPLHYGVLSPSDPPIDKEKQLQHCIDGIEQIRELFCGDKVTLAPLVTAAWYGIRYAEKFPKRIKSLVFIAACYRKQSNRSKTPKIFSDGLISVARRNDFLLDKILRIAKEHFSKLNRFSRMLEKQYDKCRHDRKVMHAEMQKFPLGERYYFMLSNSLAAIRHDFQMQYDMGWERLTELDLTICFIHGKQDKHTPINYIQEFIESDLQQAKLYPIDKCGQLVYYDHFEIIAKVILRSTTSSLNL